jgi:hypothetical protein
MTNAQLNRLDATTSVLTANDGRCWDIYGDDWAAMKADAQSLAAYEGLTIDIFNSETPEA